MKNGITDPKQIKYIKKYEGKFKEKIRNCYNARVVLEKASDDFQQKNN